MKNHFFASIIILCAMEGTAYAGFVPVDVSKIEFDKPGTTVPQKSEENTLNLDAMSAKEIERLTEEEVGKLPAIELMTVALQGKEHGIPKEKIKKIAIYMIEEALYELRFYPHLPQGKETENLEKAVKDFQIFIGSKPTGILLMGELDKLQENVEIYRRGFIEFYALGIGEKPIVSVTDEYATAEGAWEIQGDKIAFPINGSKIFCSRDEGYCREIIVDVMTPGTVGSSGNSVHFNIDDSVSYKITKWGGTDITAELSGECRATTLTINGDAKEVYQITRNKSADEKCKAGVFELEVQKLDKPRITELVGGLKVAQAYNQEKKKQSEGVISPIYKETIESVRKFFEEHKGAE